MQFPSRAERFRPALYGDTSLVRPSYMGIPPYSDHLVLEYLLTQTALYGDASLLRPPCMGIPPYSDRLVWGYPPAQTTLCGDTSLLRPPYRGTHTALRMVGRQAQSL